MLVLVLPRLIMDFHRFFSLNSVRLQLTTQTRDALDLIERLQTQARASTVELTSGRPSFGVNNPLYASVNQAAFSAIRFRLGTSGNREVYIWQDDRKLKVSIQGSPERVLSDNVESLFFAYPDSTDDRTLSTQLTLSKYPFASRLWAEKKYLQARALTVRINNE